MSLNTQWLDRSGNPVPGVTAAGTVQITVLPTNHPPTVTGPGTQAARRGVPLVFSSARGNALVAGDPDVNPAVDVLRLTLTATKGTVALGSLAGLASVSGNGTASVTLTGTLNALNAAINGLTFTPVGTIGTASLVAMLNDMGNFGLPARQAGKTVSISVT
jgi:hypothetical protein